MKESVLSTNISSDGFKKNAQSSIMMIRKQMTKLIEIEKERNKNNTHINSKRKTNSVKH